MNDRTVVTLCKKLVCLALGLRLGISGSYSGRVPLSYQAVDQGTGSKNERDNQSGNEKQLITHLLPPAKISDPAEQMEGTHMPT